MDDRRIPKPAPTETNRLPEAVVFTHVSEELLERAKTLAEDVQDRVRRVLTSEDPSPPPASGREDTPPDTKSS